MPSHSIQDLYLLDEYIKKNPSLHEEDSPWKITKITPFLDEFCKQIDKKEINLLDVGGGAGLILKAVASYLEKSHHLKVNKYVLDLTPGMIEIQKNNNPDIKKSTNEDIRHTSFKNQEIDLTLMIDVLEHVPEPEKALQELRRISNFVIFKIPLENNLILKIWNFLGRGKPRQRAIETIGHINIYSFHKLKKQIEKHLGPIQKHSFTNAFEYYLKSDYYKKKFSHPLKLSFICANYLFKASPYLCSLIFNDFAMVIAKKR